MKKILALASTAVLCAAVLIAAPVTACYAEEPVPPTPPAPTSQPPVPDAPGGDPQPDENGVSPQATDGEWDWA